MERSGSTLHDSYTTAQESPYSSRSSSAKELSPSDSFTDSVRWTEDDRATYSNMQLEDVDYENAPPQVRQYSRQNSEPRSRLEQSGHELRNSDSSSSNERMVFVQPVAHLSSEANKLVVNKVERVQPQLLTKQRSMSESGASSRSNTAADIVNISKQATVKEIPSTNNNLASASAPNVTTRPSSFSQSITSSIHRSDSGESSPKFVTPVMKRTSPQRAISRQLSRESQSSSDRQLSMEKDDSNLSSSKLTAKKDAPKSTVLDNNSKSPDSPSNIKHISKIPISTNSKSTTSSVQSPLSQSAPMSSSLLKPSSVVYNGRGGGGGADADEGNISSDSTPGDSRRSSHSSSSLASFTNVIAPCGSTEDLDNSTSDIAETADSQNKTEQKVKPVENDFKAIFAPIDSGTSDLMRDITMSLDEALSSMDEVMSRGSNRNLPALAEKQSNSNAAPLTAIEQSPDQSPDEPNKITANETTEKIDFTEAKVSKISAEDMNVTNNSLSTAAANLSQGAPGVVGGDVEVTVSAVSSSVDISDSVTTTSTDAIVSGSSHLTFNNDGRIVFTFNDSDSVASKVRFG